MANWNQKVAGGKDSPVVISNYDSGNGKTALPVIDAKGYLAAVHIKNGENFEISNLELLSDAGTPNETEARTRRYGVLITASIPGEYLNIKLKNLRIHHIFATESVKSEGKNPTSNMGQGIAVIMQAQGALIKNITIEGCSIQMTGAYRVSAFVVLAINQVQPTWRILKLSITISKILGARAWFPRVPGISL
jgi:hypothetical protein